jgi:ubiquitin-conjugating enzyme E2 J1
MFDWHFTLRGPRETEFEGGIYHGRILLPSDYPFKPPNIILLTVGVTFTRLFHACEFCVEVLSSSNLCPALHENEQPNGRFEVKKKICLSISAYHPEEWQPAWGGERVEDVVFDRTR